MKGGKELVEEVERPSKASETHWKLDLSDEYQRYRGIARMVVSRHRNRTKKGANTLWPNRQQPDPNWYDD